MSVGNDEVNRNIVFFGFNFVEQLEIIAYTYSHCLRAREQAVVVAGSFCREAKEVLCREVNGIFAAFP